MIRLPIPVPINKGILEHLAQAKDNPHFAAEHLREAVKSSLGLPGDRAVMMGRGNPTNAMFPVAPPPKKPATKTVPK